MFESVGDKYMKVVKVFNNNVVAVKKEDGTEAIVTGNGVGFKKKINDKINLARVQKIYVVEKKKRNRLYRLMETTPYEYVKIAESILEKVKNDLYPEISDLGLFGLVDHISFAIERVKKGIELPNLILKETRWLYTQEYEIAQWALNEIYKKTGVRLPDDEAGYIVLHILNASGVNKKEDTLEIVKVTKKIIHILEEEMHIEIDENDFNYYRLIMHVKYLISNIRLKQTDQLENIDNLYQMLVHNNQQIQRCIMRINAFIETEYGVTMSKDEVVYLAIHITKFVK